MYKDKFVLSVIHDGKPVKETGLRWLREVVIPFDSEYKIRLKNKNSRSCTARVFIDDKKVSQLGDFIINSYGTIDLERFVNRSLTFGKKFKFVPLDNPDVDDPTDSNNGIIKVEFRLAKEPNGIKIHWDPNATDWFVWPHSFKECKDAADDNGIYKPDGTGTYKPDWTYISSKTTDGKGAGTVTAAYCCDSNMLGTVKKSASRGPEVKNGATIEGGMSSQSFTYSELNVEDNPTILKLKIVGLARESCVISEERYCTQCGNCARTQDKYCSKCGNKL